MASDPAAPDAGREPKRTKTVQCSFCGETYEDMKYARPPYSCGAPDCERDARDAIEGEREEAHRRVDEEYGYGY